MARPVTIHDDDILAAARAVFLMRGIQATAAEVAERAGVSEGTIFKRFRTKEQLFRTAMDMSSLEPAWVEEVHDRVGQGDPRAQLVELARLGIAHLRVVVPLVMMAWSNPRGPEAACPAGGSEPPPLRALRQLTGYFRAEMDLGRVRRQDPEVVARMFMGAVWNYAHFELMFGGGEVRCLPEDEFVAGLVGTLWSGLAPATGDIDE